MIVQEMVIVARTLLIASGHFKRGWGGGEVVMEGGREVAVRGGEMRQLSTEERYWPPFYLE